MYSEDDIEAAVEAGVLSKDSASEFRAFVEKRSATSAVDEEHLRLITGFNDIFVVIAGLLLLTSCYQLGKVTVGAWVGDLLLASAAWLLSEYFVLKRRMALPAIVFLLAFVGGLFFVGLDGSLEFFKIASDPLTGSKMPAIVSTLFATLGAWLHWRRFRVPITVAAGFAALVGLAIAIILSVIPGSIDFLTLFMFIGGVVAFGYALQWDGQDPSRTTRKSDIAFWLHLLAAPMMVHPIFSLLDIFSGQVSLGKASVVVAIYIVIGLISLAVDRRALMVSALIYVLVSLSRLLEHVGSVSTGFAIAAFLIGGGLLLLSAFWHPSRSYLMKSLPLALQKRFAPFN